MTRLHLSAEVIGFFGGMGAFFGGLRFVVTRPRVWPWAAVPMAMAFVIAAVLSTLGISMGDRALDAWIGGPASPLGAALLDTAKVVVAILAIGVALVFGLLLAQPLSGPALDRIVRAQEAELGAAPGEESRFWASIGRALRVSAVTLAVGLPVVVVLTLVELAFPAAAVVTWPLKLCVSALLAAWNLVDYPFALRGHGVRSRLRWCASHAGACFGFGLVVAVLAFVPLIGLLVLPVGVAGATRLVAKSEERAT